jgi:single-strand DNA-binding protein
MTQGRDRTFRPTGKEIGTVNKVFLTGRLTRDPEMRSLASGKNVTTFTVASNEFFGGGREKAEYSNIVTWDRLAEIAGTYLGKGQQVAVEGRLQTRSWDDERGQRHWKTEIVASHVEMLSGRRKKDYEAQQAADSLVAQAERFGEAPPTEPIPESAGIDPTDAEASAEDDEEEETAASAVA